MEFVYVVNLLFLMKLYELKGLYSAIISDLQNPEAQDRYIDR